MRAAMVDGQLRTNDVSDPRVVAAMAAVPREAFVGGDRRALAYVDIAVQLSEGRALNPPMATGRLLSEARPLPGERVLLVGAATGYAAALLARLGCEVVALEEGLLAAECKRRLTGTVGVTVVEGALAAGWKKAAPYDLIFIDGAVEALSDALVAQVRDGGRIATGLVVRGVTRLAIGRKAGLGFGLASFADADAVILPGFAPAKSFSF